jgi:hypothetical protein
VSTVDSSEFGLHWKRRSDEEAKRGDAGAAPGSAKECADHPVIDAALAMLKLLGVDAFDPQLVPQMSETVCACVIVCV